jgi:hypothetical protein
MKRCRDHWLAILITLLLCPSLILWAADNFTAKDAAGVTKTFKSKEAAGGIHSPARVMVKTDGVTLYQAVEEATFTGRVGEVQASPTANTVLARLKDILSLTVLAAGSNLVGRVKIDAQTANGADLYRSLDLDETGQVVKASAGQLYGIVIYNAAVATRYIKVYDKATAPTSSDTPKMTVPLNTLLGQAIPVDIGAAFASGIGLRATTGLADADTGAPGTNDVIVTVFYK